ncbi:reverse transcriptase domain-containing protein [Tanacetum coccineum]
MEEDRNVPLILGRPFLNTADAIIRVKQNQLNLGVGTERMIFNIDSAMKHSYSNDDTCFSIDVSPILCVQERVGLQLSTTKCELFQQEPIMGWLNDKMLHVVKDAPSRFKTRENVIHGTKEGIVLGTQVAVDYVSKWAEAQALPTNDARVVVAFLKKLFCRSHAKLYSANQVYSLLGQVENTNKALKRILEKTVKDNPLFDLIAAGEKRMFQLHELDELRHQAYENSRLYKERTKVWHDRKLRMRKEFKQGNLARRYENFRRMLKIALPQLCISLCPGKYHFPLIFPILSLLSVITLRAMFNLIPVLASAPCSAKLLKALHKKLKMNEEVI